MRKRFASIVMALFVVSAVGFAQEHDTAHAKGKGQKVGHTRHHAVSAKTMARLQRDVSRLEAVLISLNRPLNFTDQTWRQSSNEALMLANRIYANTRVVRKSNADLFGYARDLRMHVREMRESALKGDSTAARLHIREALPFAYRIDDWATP